MRRCFVSVLLLLLVGGCPQENSRELGEFVVISPSLIPAGVYSGETQTYSAATVNGELVDESDGSSIDTVSFDADGIPLDFLSGEPERPGLASTVEAGDITIEQTTRSVVVAGARITVVYDAVVTYRNVFGRDTTTLSGLNQVTYTLQADSTIQIDSQFVAASESIDGNIFGLSFEQFGVYALAGSAIAPGRTQPTLRNLSCPFSLSSDATYTVTFPCVSLRAEASNEVPGAEFESYFFDDDARQTYIVIKNPLTNFPLYSSSSTQAIDASYRYDGFLQTSSGDTLIVATVILNDGQRVRYAFGQLADDQMLIVGTLESNPLATSFFGSVSLADTDGSAVLELGGDGLPTLDAPPAGGIAILSDGSAYRVNEFSRPLELAQWIAGQKIQTTDASRFSPTTPFFLTNRSTGVSIDATYLGRTTRATLNSVVDLDFDTVALRLSDGTSWRVAFASESEARSWTLGAEVAIVMNSNSVLTHSMVRLSSGRVISVEPL